MRVQLGVVRSVTEGEVGRRWIRWRARGTSYDILDNGLDMGVEAGTSLEPSLSEASH